MQTTENNTVISYFEMIYIRDKIAIIIVGKAEKCHIFRRICGGM